MEFVKNGTLWAFIILVAAITWANWQVLQIADDAKDNAAQIRDLQMIHASQTCEFTENSQKHDIAELEYLYNEQSAMDPEQRGRPGNVRNLVVAEQQAIETAAPRYCDLPGFGLYDKHPVPPPPPDGIEYHGPGTYCPNGDPDLCT